MMFCACVLKISSAHSTKQNWQEGRRKITSVSHWIYSTNLKKVYMNRFHKLLCRHCKYNANGYCFYHACRLPESCSIAEINKKKYEISFAFVNDKLKSVKIEWK